MTSPIHIDHSKLDDLRALERPGNEGFLAKIATVFIDDAGRRVEAMQLGVRSQDPAAVQMACHALKGSSSYLGATNLAELCRVMEERADQGNLGGGAEAVGEIQNELATVSALLNEAMDKA